MTIDEKLDLILGEIEIIKQDQTYIKSHLENVTDKNMLLIAESHCNLSGKLNQAKTTDKDFLYEMKVNTLTEKVLALEKEIEQIKNKML